MRCVSSATEAVVAWGSRSPPQPRRPAPGGARRRAGPPRYARRRRTHRRALGRRHARSGHVRIAGGCLHRRGRGRRLDSARSRFGEIEEAPRRRHAPPRNWCAPPISSPTSPRTRCARAAWSASPPRPARMRTSRAMPATSSNASARIWSARTASASPAAASRPRTTRCTCSGTVATAVSAPPKTRLAAELIAFIGERMPA